MPIPALTALSWFAHLGSSSTRSRRLDSHAFARLFERHSAGVYRLLRDLLRDDSAAEEATQETFVRAHERMGRLKDLDKAFPWLLGIARNIAFEHHRARRQERGENSAPAGPGPTPETLLLGGETERLLGEALAVLSADRRCALLLRLDHGLPYEDIAAAMGWSLAKVKNEIHRARLLLRERLAEHLEVTP